MKAYWDRIAVEENCDMRGTLYPDRFELVMRGRLGKALINDAGAFKVLVTTPWLDHPVARKGRLSLRV